MSDRRFTVLLCDDDPLCHATLKLMLGAEYELLACMSETELFGVMPKHKVELLLLDIRLQDERDGFTALSKLRASWPAVPVVIYSGVDDYAAVVEAMRLGAVDYIPKGCPSEKLKEQIAHALRQAERTRALRSAAGPASEEPQQSLVGESPAARALKSILAKVREASGNVIITGESGVGKEVVARLLRKQQKDAGRSSAATAEPFVTVDSSTIQGTMAESILFGHERGAFTGADRAANGLFEQANGGVIYFDEIANMPLEIQAKLLRTLQEREVKRLGSSKTLKLDFRVICATNRDLEDMCRAGEFRADLYARLNVFAIDVPPLRDRISDLPQLISHFLALYTPGNRALRFSESTSAELADYEWPGNVRELANTIQYVVTMCDDELVEPWHLPPKFRARKRYEAGIGQLRTNACSPAVGVKHTVGSCQGSLRQRMKDLERQVLLAEYEATAGNVSEMARRLDIDRSHLHSKLRQHGINGPRRG